MQNANDGAAKRHAQLARQKMLVRVKADQQTIVWRQAQPPAELLRLQPSSQVGRTRQPSPLRRPQARPSIKPLDLERIVRRRFTAEDRDDDLVGPG
ncbi:MAG: hypothetical protein K2X62_01540 [Beijerinckiaceae bacterium]|nr:hypothetical protein [Beijerinckiaceae bacterium]